MSSPRTEAGRSRYLFGIDRGGTFTDVVAWTPDGRLLTSKVLSERNGTDEDAAILGIRSILGLPDGAPIPCDLIEVVRMGTTVGTNALLERNGEPVALIVTKGFKDALRIGYQNRPRLFDLGIVLPDLLYSTVVEVDERMDATGAILRPLDETEATAALKRLRTAGYRSCAISLMHAYRHPAHERRVAELAHEAGFEHVSLSHECSGLIKYIARTDTAVVDAHLTPVLRGYIKKLQSKLGPTPLLFMQSNGGLTSADAFRGKDSVLSGPAGGIVGAVDVCRAAGFERIVGFDMGGTSTDVTHFAGEFERSTEMEIAGARLRSPTMAIHTVAAGGGSILAIDGYRLRVGPESARANPGPACYRNGGPLTVTDCNLLLGRISAEHFPRIFGPRRNQGLDLEATIAAFQAMAAQIAKATGIEKSAHECAEGFLKIAVENMANAIKKISIQRGYDVSQYTLCSFGGAGGQHACAVADVLGIPRVFVHPLAGVLSAYGMGVANLRAIEEESVERRFEAGVHAGLEKQCETLGRIAVERLVAQGLHARNISLNRRAVLRYEGSNVGLEVPFERTAALAKDFVSLYKRRYGFTIPGKALVVESLAVEAIGRSALAFTEKSPEESRSDAANAVKSKIFVDGALRELPIYESATLRAGQTIVGPAMVVDANATTIVDPEWTGHVLPGGAIVMTRSAPQASDLLASDTVDPVYLEVFNNRFMSIAEQMGEALINTAHSVNIKERLDFSCAIFDARAHLIANAPHIPIHLGAMSESVEIVLRENEGRMKPGDVFVLNSPYRGGAHLPDVTVIAPVFDRDNERLIFFTASRGHHADVGGTTPGSMPPDSTSILEEGVLIEPTLLVEGGLFLEEKIAAILGSGQYPARNPAQNIADLRAQVAACARGAEELLRLCDEFGPDVPLAYAQYVQDAAEEEVRQVITGMPEGYFTCEHDLGFQVTVNISVDREERSATIDFTGTSPQTHYNFNAPPCITRSAVLYVFRTLVSQNIPLNAGCLRPVKIIIPEGSLLNPRYPAAVAAGNPETSVLVTDALYGALQIIGGGQGTMNNLTFGNDRYQYYETICGGAGAGETFDGASAVHTHMTNSRLTDPEVLELRYPVIVDDFSIRHGSGGAGKHKGGDGTRRRLRFLQPFEMAIVANRRRTAPYGAAGGRSGSRGSTRVIRSDGRIEVLKSCDKTVMASGDVVEICTPGGGGFGAVSGGPTT